MASASIKLLTGLAMLAFAGNSLLCRIAFQVTALDAASFTSIRLLSGAILLGLIVRFRQVEDPSLRTIANAGRWSAAIALFVYAACFSMAYVSLPTGIGALLLFGAVQVTMIGYGCYRGERLSLLQVIGLVLALIGLVILLAPGLASPPLRGALLMIGSGVAWGVYSLLGKGIQNPTHATAGNFLRTAPMTLGLSLALLPQLSVDALGVSYAIASGAITSGMGYALWYYVLPSLKATQAATVQLSIPVLAAISAIFLLGESLSLRLVVASVAVLGGIALVLRNPRRNIDENRLV